MATRFEHAVEIAEIASETALRYFRGKLGIEFKSDESPVTQADRSIEHRIREFLREHYPEDGIFGEEHGIEGADSEHLWVIDPIDGTRSFIAGSPLFGFLLGHLSGGVPDIGIIGMPALGEIFAARAGSGATMNGIPIKTSGQRQLDQSILYINEGGKIFTEHPEKFARLVHSGQTRRFAHDCYSHALVAAGFADVVVDFDLKPYDYLAISAVVQAAGGSISDWSGQALNLKSNGTIISAATPELHAQVLELLQD